MERYESEALRASPLFAGMENAEALLEERVTRVSVRKGERLASAPPALRVLTRGRAAVHAAGKGGAELRILEPGDAFGAAGLFGEPSSPAVTEAPPVSEIFAESGVRLLEIPREVFWELLRADDRLLRNYLSFLSQRIVFLNRRISRFTTPDHTSRLAWYLYEQRERDGEAWLARVPNLTRLASQLGQTRVTLYRAVDALTAAGMLSRQGDRFYLPNPEALRKFALGQSD